MTNINLTIGHLYKTITRISIYEPHSYSWKTLPEKEILLLIEQDKPNEQYTRLTFLYGLHRVRCYLYTTAKKPQLEQLS